MSRLSTIIVRFYAKPGQGSALRTHLVAAMPHLNKLEGCKGGSLYHDADNADTIVLIEHWTSARAHKDYVATIEADGTMEALDPLLAKPPERKYLSGVG